jgi:peptidoglycan biosynthesis protein MviN/MurJ (putative lipid II flippase)
LEKIIKTSSHIIFWSIPATVFIFIFRVQIVSLLLGAGKFDTLAIYLTGGALAIFSLSLLFQNMSVLFIRIFYAQGKTKEPLFVNVFGALVIIFSSYFFANLFDKSLAFKNIIENIFNIKSVENIKVLTLSIGYSFGTFVSWFIYLVMVSRQFKGYLKAIYKTFLETLLASFVSGLIAYKLSVLQSSSKFTLMVLNIPAVLFAILSFVIVLLLFKNREIKEVLKSFSGRFYKSEIPKVTD